MLSKEENYYKTEYQQIPVTMLTKENLDKLEEHCKKTIHIERGIEHSVVLELLYKYKELESEKQNVIEKLEERLKELKNKCGGNTYAEIREIEWALSLVKGENDE